MGDQERKHELDRIRKAVLDAELQSGRREETQAEAKRHIVLRLASITLGVAVVVLGVILMPLPGPGLLIVIAGIALLARDVPWAHRIEQNLRRRLPKDDSGQIPRWMIFVGVGAAVVMTAASVAATFVL
jgi:uncharacterized protein (TIGR02611 family)